MTRNRVEISCPSMAHDIPLAREARRARPTPGMVCAARADNLGRPAARRAGRDEMAAPLGG
jgi:hypothetical protein